MVRSGKTEDWSYSNENLSFVAPDWVQTWPKESTEIFLSKAPSYYTDKFLKNSDVKQPPSMYARLLEHLGIRYSAFISRNSEYYVSRGKRNCFFLVFCSKVKDYTITSQKKINIESGSVYIIPPKTPIDTSAKRVNAIWFEIENTPYWQGIFGNNIKVKKSQRTQEITQLCKMYIEQLYSSMPDAELILALGKSISKMIALEFSQDTLNNHNIVKKLVDKIKFNLSENWNLEKATKYTNLKKDKLNTEFVKIYGKTFSKYLLEMRMEVVVEELKKGNSLSQTARKVGYFDSHSLALAFKKYFGFSPSKIK
ncbi:MAG: helix-turn-helix transcriptional regulator [Verrucomicrobiaceae bacterium]|nr:helix-turn-helix transcriptional regulator [Verrucomicrobiaceae bacterium]